jgi:hypothetical protein
MSLIDEALKRARQEASRQDAAAREARYARVPTYVAPVRRSRSWLLPGVVAACLVVGAAAGVLMSRSPHPLAPSPATPPALPGRGGTPAEAGAKIEAKSVQEPVPEPKVVPKPAADKLVLPKPVESPVIEQPSPSRSPSPGEGERGGGRGGQGVRAPEPAPAQAPPAPIPAAPIGPVVDLPQPPPPETRSYVREVPVEGGAALRLNGIAFSEKPVALFGDKVLAPGESVGGFTVMEIERKRVKLQGPGGTVVYVSLK